MILEAVSNLKVVVASFVVARSNHCELGKVGGYSDHFSSVNHSIRFKDFRSVHVVWQGIFFTQHIFKSSLLQLRFQRLRFVKALFRRHGLMYIYCPLYHRY